MRLVIIGGGISGLSLAYFLTERDPSLDILVFESEKRAGGKIWTDRAEGFLCEGGVNGFLDNRPRTLDLAAKLALTPVRSNDNARKRYIYSEDKLHMLPESPASFFSSNLLSLYGRLRIVWEIAVPKGGGDEDFQVFDNGSCRDVDHYWKCFCPDSDIAQRGRDMDHREYPSHYLGLQWS